MTQHRLSSNLCGPLTAKSLPYHTGLNTASAVTFVVDNIAKASLQTSCLNTASAVTFVVLTYDGNNIYLGLNTASAVTFVVK